MKPTSPIIKRLYFKIQCQSFTDFYFKITDINKTRFEIPQGGDFPKDPLDRNSFPINLAAFDFHYEKEPFNFVITRKINKAVIFSTYGSELIFSEHYIEIGTELSNSFLYGFG